MRTRAWLTALLLCGATGGHAAPISMVLGGVSVSVWMSPSAAPSPQPLVIFSHGFHGCATQSRFLMDAMATAGYVVVAPNHRDATCQGGSSSRSEKSAVPFRDAARWTEASYRDRADDIRRVLAAIPSDERLRVRTDLSRLALAGHSLGGYSVLGLAGAWPGWKLDGVSAVLALSPFAQPFNAKQTLRGLSAPVMYQGGTRDLGITPALQKSMGSYALSPSPKYYVEFDQAGHFAWTDVGLSSSHAGIVAYSVAFLNHYVKGEPAAATLTSKLPGVAAFQYASELGTR
jgi:predicted dienelactone hydrolase